MPATFINILSGVGTTALFDPFIIGSRISKSVAALFYKVLSLAIATLVAD